MAEEINEPDRVPGAPHPRETPALIGQESAETTFLDGFITEFLVEKLLMVFLMNLLV